MIFLEEKNKKDEDILRYSIKKPSLFEIIVDRYQESFLRTAEKIVLERESAEDIVQEVFIKIYMNAPRFKEKEGASFKSWAYKILLNTSFSHYRKIKKRRAEIVQIDHELYENIADTDDCLFEREELRDLVISVLSRMPKKTNKILSLRFLQDLSQKTIATQEGISVAAVKTRVHRGKKEFKKVISSFNLLRL
jgi:RNA polymerase sigma-70 factor (ECF subfamily)